MAGTGLVVVLLLSISLPSDADTLHHARFQLRGRDMKFKRARLNFPTSRTMKLIPGQKGAIYTGSGRHLAHLNFQENQGQPMVQSIPSGCKGANCSMTVMQPGRHGHPLFVCITEGEHTTCCYKALNGSTIQGPVLYGGGEPALLIGHALYTTQSGSKDKDGIYRTSVDPGSQDDMSSPSRRSDQQYVRVIHRRDKIYAFYTQKNLDEKRDVDIFTSKISRICMSDLGGSKDILQFQWTSQLIGRLSCGDPSRKLYYNELLDVAVLPSANGEADRIYGLFKNGWEMRAVCTYTMDVIDAIFSKFSTKAEEENNPGECVENSRQLPAKFLQYMKSSPEAMDEVKPSMPLLVSHRQYSHLQVDHVGATGQGQEGQEGHNILLLTMESGAVHKVLENGTNPFIISEYHPFQPGTRILSMLLDSSEKKLYVSSSAEVVQIDLRNCSVYGDQCADCILARDPYCGWDHVHKKCSPYSQGMKQDIHSREYDCVPESALMKYSSKMSNPEGFSFVSKSSRHYLACPMQSHHAKYRWLQDGEERPSLMDKEQSQLVLLIEDMGLDDEGDYRCVSTEGDYNKTVAQYSLKISSGGQGLRSHPVTLALASLVLMLVVVVT